MRATDLRGRVLVVDFIFTRCTLSCPAITSHMAELAGLTADAPGVPIDMVSITVDPQHDTPEVLSEFSSSWSIPDERWHLLTGTTEQIDEVSAGMLQALTRGDGPAPDVTHSQRFVLVDAEGRLRAMPSASAEELDPLAEQALLLSRTGSRQ
ncbi:MAG TPA: SCO family protein [Myxococcota bacterium]|nr:SCO family protein [Myxococcota bacterium]